MKKKFSIRLISNDEIQKVTDWARLEGFAPGFGDISIYKNTDKKGVWVGCLDDNPIGSIACVKYNPSYGFIGLFIVKKEFRNLGYGKDVDHKNGNPRDNSRKNLKMKTKAKNRSFPRNSKAKKR